MKEERILYPSGDDILGEETSAEIRAAMSETMPPGWVCEMAGRG